MNNTRRWLFAGLSIWLATVGAFLLSRRSVDAARASVVRVRQSIVEDENGKERIVIASSLPDPIVNGKVERRTTAVSSALQFQDANGNERGGIAALARGSLLFEIDDELGGERSHLYYIPKSGSGIYLQGENPKETVSLVIPPRGADPVLEMSNQAGDPVATVSVRGGR